MRVVCENCQTQNSLIIHSREVEERLVLSCLHTGIGHSHLEALLNITGLPCMAEGTFKGVERSVGHTVETALSESCTKWKNEEKKLESSVDTDSQLKGAYDTSWSKRGGGYNALTGRGTIVGTNTGKCIEYGIKNKMCHICQRRKKLGKDAKTHDCRKISVEVQNLWNLLFVRNCLRKINIK